MIKATLGEGSTPLVESVSIGKSLRLEALYFKLETCNPSGSYKDRFAAAEMSRMLNAGVRACVATSSGNTGSALAAYSARYGVACAIVVNQHAPAGKLYQMQAHGARVIRVRDFATEPAVTMQVYDLLAELSKSEGIPLVVSAYRYCPEGMAGVESLSEEIARQAPQRLDHVFVPVGGGGLFTAVCRGFSRPANAKPRVHAIQPEGCSTVVASFERGDTKIRPVNSTTGISGLSVPFDIDGSLALSELRRSGGFGLAVSDEEVLDAQRLLLGREGIYTEPAGATALAGLLRARREGRISEAGTAVCLVTGHGFKDPNSVERAAAQHPAVLTEAGQLKSCLMEAIAHEAGR